MEIDFVALLPIKKNSERVPGKNFKLFHQKPLFHWILETLLSVESIKKIIINTDASETLEQSGFKPHEKIILRERKKEICGDFVSMNKVIEDDINSINNEFFLMTHVTNPLISSTTLQKALNTFEEMYKEGYDSLFSVNKYQSRFYTSDGKAMNHEPDRLLRTQDLDPVYEENSCFYVFSKKSFKKMNARIGERPFMFVTPPAESIDIDDNDTWKIAEMLVRPKFSI